MVYYDQFTYALKLLIKWDHNFENNKSKYDEKYRKMPSKLPKWYEKWNLLFTDLTLETMFVHVLGEGKY